VPGSAGGRKGGAGTVGAMATGTPETTTRPAGTLVYDGDCAFCTRTARWVERRTDGDAVAVEPWQALDLPALGLTEEQTTTEAWWVDDRGRTSGGHRAVARALVAIGGIWALAGRLLLTRPVGWVAAPVYRLVARYRHRMPGGTDACRIDLPPPAEGPRES